MRIHSRPSCRVIGCCTIAVYRDPRPVTRWSRVSVLTISERRAVLGNDTPVPKQMNGAVSGTRLGINRWLPFWVLFCPGLGYYRFHGEALKAAVFLRVGFQREFESISLLRRVRSEPGWSFRGTIED